METVKVLIETIEDLQERKQVLYSRLFDLSGKDPLQEESIHTRLEKIEYAEALALEMILNPSTLTQREARILNMRSLKMKLSDIGKLFGISYERVRQILGECYEKLAVEFKDELLRVEIS